MGSCYIDDQFVQLLGDIFKPQWISDFGKELASHMVELLHNFQEAKAGFYNDSNKKHHNVRLPQEFIGFIQDKLRNIQMMILRMLYPQLYYSVNQV